MNEDGKNKREEAGKKWTVLLLLLLLLILVIMTLPVLLKRGNNAESIVEIIVPSGNSGDGVGLTIDPDAGRGQMSGNDNAVEQDVVISGLKSMAIPAKKKEVTVNFNNPKENEGAYYLTFELRLCNDSESGYEVLYTSGLIPPEKQIDRIELSHALNKGVYDAVVHIQPYRMNEEKTHTNNADIKIRLIVN